MVFPQTNFPTRRYAQNPRAVETPVLTELPGSLGNFCRRWLGTVGIRRLDTQLWAGQCVSLVARYVQELALPPELRSIKRRFGDGRHTAHTLASQFPHRFAPACPPSGTSLPAPGAVISFSGAGSTTRFGHTAIVVAVRQPVGQPPQMKVLESNADNRGPKSKVQLSEWLPILLPGPYGRVVAFTQPKI